MTRLPTVDPAQATGKSQALLAAVQQKLGAVPNMMRVLANAPAALDGYLQLSGALAAGSLGAKAREQIALTVAEANLCDYCLSAHSFLGGKLGLSADQLTAARNAVANDPHTDALLKLARTVVVQRGNATAADLRAARSAGVSDGEILEVVAHVALNVLTNYTNIVAQTAIDFPKVASASATDSGEACATDTCRAAH